MCSIKKGVLKNFAIFTEKHLCQSLFLCCNFIKNETLAQEFSCEFCKIFKIIFFHRTPLDDCFYLQKLLALYFAIIYSWQLSSSEKSFSREKQFIYVSQGFYRFRFLFFHFFSFCSFCLTNTCLPCQLRKAYVP